MNLSDFKLIKEHPDFYEVGHPNGRSMKISKAGLSEDAHAHIKKMADGGNVSSPDYPVQSSSQPDELSQIESEVAATPAAPQGKMDYENALEQQRELNPGEPPEFQENTAITQALGEAGARQVEQNRASNALLAQQQAATAQNARRAQLGLDPLPVPGPDLSAPAQTDQGPEVAQGPAPASAPTGAGFPQLGQESILNQQQSALGGYGKTLAGIAQNEQEIAKNYQAQQAQYQATSDAHFAQMRADMDKDRQAIIAGKVDPNNFWNTRTTGQKVSGILSVILGGIGGALTHQENPGVVLLNNAINRDIEGQRTNLGKQNSLYSMELQRYGDERSAYVATQAHMLNAAQAQLSAYGMQAQSAAQQASIAQAQQGLELQKMQLQRELANRLTSAQLLGAVPNQAAQAAGHQGGGIPTSQVGMYALNNPKGAENLINLDNNYSYQFKGTPQNAQDFQNFEQTAGSVIDNLAQLKKLGAAAEIPNSKENRMAQVLIGNLTTQIPQMRSSQIGAKRISEVETENAQKLLPDPRNISGLVNSATALDQFANGIKKERESARQGNLIGYAPAAPLRTFKPD
jgi:hypothetical protein